MRRLDDERGAVAVVVALALIALLGVSALVLDAGNLYWERRQLQAGADAGALAAAQDFAAGEDAAALASAKNFADQNNVRGAYVDDVNGFQVDASAQEVTVTAQTGSPAGPEALRSWVAGVLGIDDYATSATATAAWGPVGGAATLPITFSYCEWEELVGDVDNPTLPTGSKTLQFLSPGGEDCKGPAGHYAPGGWGWLDTNSSDACTAEIVQGEVDGRVSQGNPSAFDSTCTPEYFQSLIGQTVLMPIFEKVEGAGDGAVYTISGFAAIEIEGYRLHAGHASWSYNAPCGNPNTCIRANFVDFVTYGDHVDWGGGPDFGTSIVSLVG
jgi:Flp pilus assembly protein TadG